MFYICDVNNDIVSIKDTSDGVVENYKISDLSNISTQVDLVGYEKGLIFPVVDNKTMVQFFNDRLFDKFLNHFTYAHFAEVRYSIKGGMFVNNYVYTIRKEWGTENFSWADHDSSKRRSIYNIEEMIELLNSIPRNAICYSIKFEP